MTSMTAVELNAVRQALRNRLAELERIKTTCDHCAHFSSAPHCTKFDADVPDDFRRTPDACEHWHHDRVPF